MVRFGPMGKKRKGPAAGVPRTLNEILKARWREVWGDESPLNLYVKQHGHPPVWPRFPRAVPRG